LLARCATLVSTWAVVLVAVAIAVAALACSPAAAPQPVEVTRVVIQQVEVPVTQIVEMAVEATPTVAPTSQSPSAEPTREPIIFSDLNWSSVVLQNRIAQYIVEIGYGYPTEARFGTMVPMFQGLKNGDTHVTMEIWLPNQEEVWNSARDDGEVLSIGQSLGKDWQSAFVIPRYLQEQYPELDSVEDLKEQKYKDLFKTPETGDKARLVSCIVSWACERVNAAQILGYGLSDHVEIFNPGDGAELNRIVYEAYEKQEPWLGYQWGTNEPALNLDLVRLEEPPYSDECWFTTKACAYEDATILIGVNYDLPGEPPTSWRCSANGISTSKSTKSPPSGRKATRTWASTPPPSGG